MQDQGIVERKVDVPTPDDFQERVEVPVLLMFEETVEMVRLAPHERNSECPPNILWRWQFL